MIMPGMRPMIGRLRLPLLMSALILLVAGCAVRPPPPAPPPGEAAPPPMEETAPPAAPLPGEDVREEVEYLPLPEEPPFPAEEPPTSVESTPRREEDAPSGLEASLPPELHRYRSIRSESLITRGQTAELLASLAGGTETGSGVIMTDIFDHPYRESIIRMVAGGYMNAFPNHTFRPEALVSRAEMAGFIWEVARSASGLDPVRIPGWDIDDLPPTNRFYLPVKAVLHLGIMDLNVEGAFGPTEPVTGREAWDMYIRLYNLTRPKPG